MSFTPRPAQVGEPTMTLPVSQIEEIVRRADRPPRDGLLDALVLGVTVLVWAAVVGLFVSIGLAAYYGWILG